MHLARLILATLTSLALLAAPLVAHGGAYRGPTTTAPADSVPPGGPAPPKGDKKASGGSGGSGAARPGAGAAQPGLGPSTKPVALTGIPVDLTTWRRWWGFNQYLHLDVKGAVYRAQDPIGGDVFFLGRGGPAGVQDRLQPNADDIHGSVAPALLRALAGERDQDLVTGCLIAIAKIGDRNRKGGHSPTTGLLRKYLGDPNQEIAETAAVSLGILGAEGAAPLLRNLLLNGPAGRAAVGRETGVPWRTRAFAAYGMGLLGRSLGDPEARQDLAEALVQVLDRDARQEPTADLGVACVSALGLLSLPTRNLLGPAGRQKLTRETQVQRLMAALEDEGMRVAVRAHVPIALARVTRQMAADHPLRLAVIERFAAGLGKSEARAEVQAGFVLGLGRLCNSGSLAIDRLGRAALIKATDEGRGKETRRFAMLSLAEVAARPGPGAAPLLGLEVAREKLLEHLDSASSITRPWAAVALGVLGRRLQEAGLDSDPAVDAVLLGSLESGGGPEELGALAIACGLRRIEGSVTELIQLLRESSVDQTRGFACQALGMIGNGEAIEPVRELVRASDYRPNLLRQGSTSLGLLGDKTLLPELVARLESASSLSVQASLAQGLGTIGDVRSLGPLLRLLNDQDQSARARAFAAVALGLVCDTRHRPWNTALAEGIDYRSNVPTLTDGGGAGILEIF